MREFLAILIPYLFGCVASYLMFQPMKQFEDGYKRAKEHYSNWNRGFDEGFAAAKKHYQDWDEGFGEGFESGWNCALEQKGGGNRMKCGTCEWFRYPMLTDNSLKNKLIPTIITDLRRCERGWCDKEEGEK